MTSTCEAGVTLVLLFPGTNGSQEDDVARLQGDGPALPLYLTEAGRAVAELGLYLAARPLEPSLPRGDGHPVLVLPGLLADDSSTRALRAVLRRLGYRVHGWGLGRNIGPTAVCVNGLQDKLEYLHGLPSVITWRTASGLRRARSRAKMPPRLQPITVTGRR